MPGRRVEGKRVDRHIVLTKPDLEIAPLQQPGKFSVAVSEIENDRQRGHIAERGSPGN